jgi:hypothetical protein
MDRRQHGLGEGHGKGDADEADGGRIKPLPHSVYSQIQSSVVINTLSDAVLGLLRNSLDARATRIEITVNQARGGCTVEDDGLGIHPREFQNDGGLGKMHRELKPALVMIAHSARNIKGWQGRHTR